MPTVKEFYDAGQLNLYNGNFNSRKSTASKVFIVSDAKNECEAVAAAFDQAPNVIYDNDGNAAIPKRTAQINERCGDRNWKVTVEYSYDTTNSSTSDQENADNASKGGGSNSEPPEVCFQSSATTTTVYVPINQTCVYSRTGKGLGNANGIPIGWNGKTDSTFSASGIEVPVSDLREQYTKIMRYSTVRSSAWRRKIALCTGKVNSGDFKGWKRGEVMFNGCSYQTPQDSDSKVRVTFEFTIRLNETDVKIAGIPIGSVNGHDYAWAIQDNTVSPEHGVRAQIKAIFVAQVVPYVDFDILGV